MLRITLLALVLATFGTLAYANHSEMQNVGDEAQDVIFKPGVSVCQTLDNLHTAINGTPPPTCGRTNVYLMTDVVLVEDYEAKGNTYRIVQMTVKAQMVSPTLAIPLPTQVFFVVWEILEGDGQPT